MSKVSTLLVWAKVHPAVFASSVMRSKFQPGEVVDVQPGMFDFGADIPRLGWWKVIVCTAPAEKTRGLLTGDPLDENRPDAPRRLRVRRLDLDKLGEQCSFEELMAAATEVPPLIDSSVIGEPYNVIG